MQRLEIKYQIQLTHILKQPVQSFDEDLDEVEEREGGFCRGGDEDEVQGGVVAVGDEGGGIVVELGGGRGGG